MKIIRIDAIEFQVNDDRIVKMMECIIVDKNQAILIRNKKEALKLSQQIVESSEQMRRERYLEAVENNDRLYLNTIYESLTVKDLLRLFFQKIQKHI